MFYALGMCERFAATTLPPASIPSAVDPHTVERAWFMASRWSAPLYERPGRHGPRLLGLPGSTVDGMEAHHAHHDVPAAGNGTPSHPVPADPPPEAPPLTCGEHPPLPVCTQRAAGRGQPGRRQEAGRAAEAARARAVRGP